MHGWPKENCSMRCEYACYHLKGICDKNTHKDNPFLNLNSTLNNHFMLIFIENVKEC